MAPRRKKSGAGGATALGLFAVFVVGVLWAVAQDAAKAETESVLKRNGLWPRA